MKGLYSMLETMAVIKASDLYLNVGAPPTFKVDGQLRQINDALMTPEDIRSLVVETLDEEQKVKFDKHLELDISLQIENGGRFRINLYRQKGAVALVARHIKNIIPTIDELKLPQQLKEFAMVEQGLVLVVGATGVGKSTTLASMIDYRNENSQGHILTVEDPIEFVHYHKQSLISQREVGVDTESYKDALKYALRESPNVIVIGEIRDQETAEQALRFAETGHLCLATLHASSANLAIDRLVNFFPQDSHHRIYRDVASHLVAIVAQRLAKGITQPKVPVTEILHNTMHVKSLIERNDLSELKEAMNSSATCQTFQESLFNLVVEKKITREEAVRLADSEVDLLLRFRMDHAI